MGEPFVSVIIPIYNTEEFIERSVESIIAQSYGNLEIILVDDGSEDGSREACRKLIERDSRIKYFYQKNRGVSAARNLGLKEATGKYIFFCDSDDTWKSGLIKKVVRVFEEKGSDMVRFGFESMTPDLVKSSELMDAELLVRDAVVEYFSNDKVIFNMSGCVLGAYRRSVILENELYFDEELAMGEDGKFVMQYLLCCESIYLLGENLYNYYPYFEHRVNATARKLKVLYNGYELNMILFRMFWDKWDELLREDEKQGAYAKFIDRLIGELVRFAVYTPCKTAVVNVKKMKGVIEDEGVRSALKYYQTLRKTDSRLIPFFMKRHCAWLLWLALKIRKQNYYQINGKKRYGVSIWKKDPMVEYG